MGASVNDRTDIIARAFNVRFQTFLADIWQRSVLERVRGYSYAIEFQKKGLPHAHVLLIMHEKIHTQKQADRLVCAELPDTARHRLLYDLVSEHMMHGPCGELNPKCPCMEQGLCRCGYPKPLLPPRTRLPVLQAARLRDPDATGVRQSVGGTYKTVLLLRYRCHINLEICTTIHCIKYICEYVHKGANRALIEARQRQQPTRNATPGEPVDEVQQYLDTRYIAPNEAACRIFKYKIHGQSSRGPARAPSGGTGGPLPSRKPREGATQHQAHEARGPHLAERTAAAGATTALPGRAPPLHLERQGTTVGSQAAAAAHAWCR